MTMELVLDNLACSRGGRRIFENLSFRLGKGEIALLRGPNGAGKSSLLRVLAGLTPPSGGDAVLDGLSLQKDRGDFQDRISFAGHLDAVKPALGVRDNLVLWASIFDAQVSGVDDALAYFQLHRIAQRPVLECSAGQKRRLGLARLMLSNRPLWLLDEPTVSLDAEGTKLIAALVERHVSSGGLAMIATHIDLGLSGTLLLELGRAVDTAQSFNADNAFLDGDWR